MNETLQQIQLLVTKCVVCKDTHASEGRVPNATRLVPQDAPGAGRGAKVAVRVHRDGPHGPLGSQVQSSFSSSGLILLEASASVNLPPLIKLDGCWRQEAVVGHGFEAGADRKPRGPAGAQQARPGGGHDLLRDADGVRETLCKVAGSKVLGPVRLLAGIEVSSGLTDGSHGSVLPVEAVHDTSVHLHLAVFVGHGTVATVEGFGVLHDHHGLDGRLQGGR